MVEAEDSSLPQDEVGSGSVESRQGSLDDGPETALDDEEGVEVEDIFVHPPDQESSEVGVPSSESNDESPIRSGEQWHGVQSAASSPEEWSYGRRYWTDWASEEDPPIDCSSNDFVRAFDCRGPYCNDVQLQCESVDSSINEDSWWSSWFSNENQGRRICGGDAWMTGVKCKGWWCDSLSIRCTRSNMEPTDCQWSGRYSEEDHWFTAPSGYYIRGISCHGSYCNDKRYRYCKASPKSSDSPGTSPNQGPQKPPQPSQPPQPPVPSCPPCKGREQCCIDGPMAYCAESCF